MNRSRRSDAVGGMAEDPPMPVRVSPSRQPWNKGLLVGQKKPLEPKHVWSIRVRLETAGSKRDLAIFNLAIDSKLRACDLVKLRLDDICSGLECGDEQRSCKRRLVDQSNSRSRSSQGIPSKLGCHHSGPPALDTSSQVDFTRAFTYQPASMPAWCIAGLKALT
jgi:hypothetical protein